MEPILKIKEGHKATVIGFNNSGKPLGERDDLHLLYRDAKAHNVKHLLDLFEDAPTEESLLEKREELFNQQQAEKHNTDVINEEE